ncbi:hypothetical protein G9A89_021570 [Geosiphon pyriformis]|nr:hypothetical protein G9A89_021570 [Geosiphon pyriformis]
MSALDLDDDQSSVASFPLPREAHLSGPPSAISGLNPGSSTITVNTILPPDQPNVNFKPTTTAISKNSKLKLHVLLDSTIYTAGGTLNGRFVLTSSTSRSLKVAEISVELTAYEELTTREYTATQSFLSSRLVFQGSNLPASNAVHGPRDPNGFWTAKKGKTTFPFAFKIPIDAPSSFVYGNVASLRYVITGVVQIFYNNKEDTIFKSKEAFVVEAWDGHNPIYKQPVDAMNMKQLWMGGTGAVTLEGTLVETLFTSGGNISAQVRVCNETKRRVQGLKLAVTQRLLILANKNKKEADDTKIIAETLAEEWFKNKDFLFDCGEDRTTTVNLHVPNTVRTIRNTALFEVSCHVVISLYLGPFMKDLTVELPASICHSASLQPPPIADLELNHFPNHYNMIDETNDFFVEDIRQDDSVTLGSLSQPVNIPQRNRALPWDQEDENAYRGRYSPTGNSTGSYILGSASPKKLGSWASSLIGRPKQMATSNPSKLIPKSPPLAPASPYAYIPAIERVRYLAFPTQQQALIQNRQLPSPSRNGAYGIYIVQTWLEGQQSTSRPDSPDRASSISSSNPRDTSPWANLNRSQEVVNETPLSHSFSRLDTSLEQKHQLPFQGIHPPKSEASEDAFQRNNSLLSSSSGPSGLTLLMRQKPSPPSSIIDQFSNTPGNPISRAYDHVPQGRPLPPPPTMTTENNFQDNVINEKSIKSKFLQIPGKENEGELSNDENPIKESKNEAGVSSLSSLLKWGTSWIGYGSTSKDQEIPSTKDNPAIEKIILDKSKEVTEPQPTGVDTDLPLPDVTISTKPNGNLRSSTHRNKANESENQNLSNPTPVQPITKASIFAALGQKPLGTSPPAALNIIDNMQNPKPRPPSVVKEKEMANSPKQKGFQVTRKPLSENKFLDDADKFNIVAAEAEIIDEKKDMMNLETKMESNHSLNNNADSKKSVTAAATTYVNNTIPKPILVLDKITRRGRRKKVGVENDDEDLKAKIITPPKPVLSPRILNLMNQLSPSGGVDNK